MPPRGRLPAGLAIHLLGDVDALEFLLVSHREQRSPAGIGLDQVTHPARRRAQQRPSLPRRPHRPACTRACAMTGMPAAARARLAGFLRQLGIVLRNGYGEQIISRQNSTSAWSRKLAE